MSKLPSNVIALGVVSLLMGVSSQMIHSLLPIYLVVVLGASTVSVGFIEGIAEATNAMARFFAGALSDSLGRRKPLVVLGYGLAALSKPLFPLSTGVGTVLLARFLDRTGKGIRDAPRDALLADQLARGVRGTGFGLRLTLFTMGSVIGPLIAAGLMLTGSDYRVIFWVAVVPAALSVVVLVACVHETPGLQPNGRLRFSWRELGHLPTILWWVVSVAAVLELARFSQAFLLLKARDVGVETAWVPVFLVLMSAVYGATAYPFGILADNGNRRAQLLAGVLVLAACYLILAWADSPAMTALGAVLWGLQLGMTQGLIAATIADAAPENLRGTAFGIYYLVDGVASLIASAGAGVLWSIAGPAATFAAGTLLAAAVAVMLVLKPLPRLGPA